MRYRAAAKAEADLGAQPVEIMKADRASSMERAPSYPGRTGKKTQGEPGHSLRTPVRSLSPQTPPGTRLHERIARIESPTDCRPNHLTEVLPVLVLPARPKW